MNTILELQNISFQARKTNILKDISFSVAKGEVVSIIGVNGSGKSTLLKLIAGIYKLHTGKLIKNYTHLSYVPQKIDIDKSFPISVLEFIQIYNRKVKKVKIDSYFQKFRVTDILAKPLAILSGGEFQKVLIISALLKEPELLLLDEPTSGIDIIGEEIFYKNIAEIKNIFPEISIILVSHNLHLVYKNSDKVICLHKNNFCCHGTPTQIQENKYVKEIFGPYLLPYKHHPHKKEEHIHLSNH